MNKNGYQEIVVSGWNKTSIFEVEAVRLLRPNGGENFIGGDQEIIKWRTFYPPRCDSLSLLFSRDNGRSYEIIASGIPGTDTSSLWSVPNISSDSCRIKIIAYGPGWQYDESDGLFSITPTGMEENQRSLFPPLQIYPNPNKGVIKIRYSLPKREDTRIEICDASGRQIRDFFLPKSKTSGILELNPSNFPHPNGIYFFRFETKRETYIKKLIWPRWPRD